MILIAGLGNPEQKYFYTYHNVGFLAIDYLANILGAKFTKKGCKAIFAETWVNGEKIIIAKPQTYMNLSGESILSFKQKYKLQNENIYVFCDDIDLPPGKIRFRKEGSAGTHNGLKSIVMHLGQNFNRIRIGVGRDENFKDLADFVLSKISDENWLILKNAINTAATDMVKLLEEKNGNK